MCCRERALREIKKYRSWYPKDLDAHYSCKRLTTCRFLNFFYFLVYLMLVVCYRLLAQWWHIGQLILECISCRYTLNPNAISFNRVSTRNNMVNIRFIAWRISASKGGASWYCAHTRTQAPNAHTQTHGLTLQATQAREYSKNVYA